MRGLSSGTIKNRFWNQPGICTCFYKQVEDWRYIVKITLVTLTRGGQEEVLSVMQPTFSPERRDLPTGDVEDMIIIQGSLSVSP